MKVYFVVFISILFLSCAKPNADYSKKTDFSQSIQGQLSQIQNSAENKPSPVKALVQSMTIEQKISQLFLVSIDGTRAKLSANLHHVPPGGYILFSRNFIGNPEQIIELTGTVQSFYTAKEKPLPEQVIIPPFFAIDQEGGEVNRLRGIASPLPSANAVVRFLTLPLAQKLYAYAARQVAALGIHVNLAPVIEVSYKHNADFLGLRSFGSIEKVYNYGGIFIKTFNEAGIYCVLKHYPGNTNDDPHFGLPLLNETASVFDSLYLDPFRHLLMQCSDQKLGILAGHAIIAALDKQNPACLSRILVEDTLKQKLGFKGLVFSDDLLMDALTKNGFPPEAAAETAIRAGVHVLMLSHAAYWNFIPALKLKAAADTELQYLIDEAVIKIIEAKIDMGLMELQTNFDGKTIVLFPSPLKKRYNPVLQLEQFIAAKKQGEALYYEYWAK